MGKTVTKLYSFDSSMDLLGKILLSNSCTSELSLHMHTVQRRPAWVGIMKLHQTGSQIIYHYLNKNNPHQPLVLIFGDFFLAQGGQQGFSIPTYHQNWCPFLFLKTCLLHVKITRILLCIQFQLCTRGNFGLWSHTDGPTHRRTMLNCSLIFSHLHTSGFLSKNNLYKTGIMIDQMSQLTCKVDQNENLCKLSKSILCKDLLCLFP